MWRYNGHSERGQKIKIVSNAVRQQVVIRKWQTIYNPKVNNRCIAQSGLMVQFLQNANHNANVSSGFICIIF